MEGVRGFVDGGIASIAAGSSLSPIIVIRTLPAQLTEGAKLDPRFGKPPGIFTIALQVARHEGLFGLFTHAPLTLRRQLLYLTTRMGLYDIIKSKWTTTNHPDQIVMMPFKYKVGAGVISGGVGALVGNPVDAAVWRMSIADYHRPLFHPRSYKNVVQAVGQMVKHEGLTSLWRGSSMAVTRAMLVTSSQLAIYDQIKETIVNKKILKDRIGTHVLSSLPAGFVAALVSYPLDGIRNRIERMKEIEAAGREPHKRYAGVMDCAIKNIRSEGPMSLYKGFGYGLTQQMVFTVVLFVTLEQVRKVF